MKMKILMVSIGLSLTPSASLLAANNCADLPN
jgi:hypothetical protein